MNCAFLIVGSMWVSNGAAAADADLIQIKHQAAGQGAQAAGNGGKGAQGAGHCGKGQGAGDPSCKGGKGQGAGDPGCGAKGGKGQGAQAPCGGGDLLGKLKGRLDGLKCAAGNLKGKLSGIGHNLGGHIKGAQAPGCGGKGQGSGDPSCKGSKGGKGQGAGDPGCGSKGGNKGGNKGGDTKGSDTKGTVAPALKPAPAANPF